MLQIRENVNVSRKSIEKISSCFLSRLGWSSSFSIFAALKKPNMVSYSVSNLSGKVIGNYLLEEVLGSGGYGTVYGATKSGVKCAVKVSVNGQSLSLEGEILRKLVGGPNVIQLMSSEIVGEFHLLVLERGFKSLDVLKWGNGKGFFEKPTIQMIVWQVTKGLEFAHSFGITHRDLKAGNIIVSEPRGETNVVEVKIVDFGIGMIGGNEDTSKVYAKMMHSTPYTSLGNRPTALDDLLQFSYCLLHLAGHDMAEWKGSAYFLSKFKNTLMDSPRNALTDTTRWLSQFFSAIGSQKPDDDINYSAIFDAVRGMLPDHDPESELTLTPDQKMM